jgi:hypothetical protein
LRIKATQRSRNPQKIVEIVAGFVFGNPMHSKSFGLQGEEKFGSCKKKLDTMMGSLEDSHPLNKVNFSLP